MSKHASTSLASFMRAAELGSFAAAGRVLGISAAAVGQNVKRLEEEYGIKLFNRTTRNMSLTPEGSLLFQRAKAPLEALEEIENLFHESKGVVSGPLRISSPKRFAYHTLMPLLAKFKAYHPRVSIELDASDVVRNLAQDPVDVSFRIGVPNDSTMIARPLSRMPIYTFASPEYIAQRGEPHHIQDLADHECLQYRFPTSNETWAWAFSVDGEISRVQTAGNMVFNDPECILAAGREGMGLFQMDAYYSRDDVLAGQIVPVMKQFSADMQSMFLCYASRENMPLRVRAFIDFIVDNVPRDAFILEKLQAN